MTAPKRREMSIEKVQQWIITALICAVSSFPIGALIIVTHVNREKDPTGAVMLCVMTAAIGIFAMTAIRLMHRKSPISAFTTLGLLPAIGSAVWTWGF